jgi:hypothetical protein
LPKRSKPRKGKAASYFRLRKQRRVGLWIVILAVIIVGGLAAFLASSYFSPLGLLGTAHDHADFKVYIQGQPIDFSQPKYQLQHSNVHVEGGDGDVIHMHAARITIGAFFDTLRIRFNSTCFVLDTGQAVCNDATNTLKFYVNGQPNNEFDRYVLRHLDRILVSYGNETDAELQAQLDSVTRKAGTT